MRKGLIAGIVLGSVGLATTIYGFKRIAHEDRSAIRYYADILQKHDLTKKTLSDEENVRVSIADLMNRNYQLSREQKERIERLTKEQSKLEKELERAGASPEYNEQVNQSLINATLVGGGTGAFCMGLIMAVVLRKRRSSTSIQTNPYNGDEAQKSYGAHIEEIRHLLFKEDTDE